MSNLKPGRKELIGELADQLVYYIGEGVSVDSLIEKTDVSTDIRGLTQLLEAGFVTTGVLCDPSIRYRKEINIDEDDTTGIKRPDGQPIGVLDFISLLDHRLRSLDPVSRKEMEILKGHTRGRVDWNTTIKHRYSNSSVSSDEFACHVRRKSVASDNNRVLAALLQTISNIINDLQESDVNLSGNSWLAVWGSDQPAYSYLESALDNIFMKQFDVDHSDVSSRTIQAVRTDRNPFYREAAVLLEEYKRLDNKDLTEKEARKLLSTDIFALEDTDENNSTLFELYWIFKILDLYPDAEFYPISDNSKLIAKWTEDEYQYRMYTEWDGKTTESDEEKELLKFKTHRRDYDEAKDRDLSVSRPGLFSRHSEVNRQNHKIGSSVFNLSPETTGERTPDIVMLRTKDQTGEFAGVFLGEVKWSTTEENMRQGLEQTLRYGADAKLGDHLQRGFSSDRKYVASNADPIASPELSLGFFVGHNSVIEQYPDGNIQIRGYDDSVRDPFEDIDID